LFENKYSDKDGEGERENETKRRKMRGSEKMQCVGWGINEKDHESESGRESEGVTNGERKRESERESVRGWEGWEMLGKKRRKRKGQQPVKSRATRTELCRDLAHTFSFKSRLHPARYSQTIALLCM
jgi:hypothetical protein